MPIGCKGKGGSKGPVAYYAVHKLPWPTRRNVVLRIDYDCIGIALGPCRRFRYWPFPGAKPPKIKSFKSYGWTWMTEEKQSEGVLVAVMTLEMYREKCCPPELVAELLGASLGPG